MASLVVIWWRDIPAQVLAKDGRRSEKVILPGRFEAAIDRAAVKAGKTAMNDYVAEWRRESRACGDDLGAEATAEAGRLDTLYPQDILNRLVEAGGIAPAVDGGTASKGDAS